VVGNGTIRKSVPIGPL